MIISVVMGIIMVALFILIQLFVEANGRDIIVSHGITSDDQINCGNSSSPCKSITYAISIMKDGDILKLEGGVNHEYDIGGSIFIKKSITIQNRYLGNPRFQKPTIVMDRNINAVKGKYMFICHKGNITLSEIIFNVRSTQKIGGWFYINTNNSKTIFVNNCDFQKGLAFRMSQLRPIKEQTVFKEKKVINIQNTKFFNGVLTSNRKMRNKQYESFRMSVTNPGEIKAFHIEFTNGRIFIRNSNTKDTTIKCKGDLVIQNSSFHCIHIKNFVKNLETFKCKFKDSYLINTYRNNGFNISNTTFDNSPLILKRIQHGFISDTVFKNINVSTPALAMAVCYESRINHHIEINKCLFSNNSPRVYLTPTISIKNHKKKTNVIIKESQFVGSGKEIMFDLYTRIRAINSSFQCGKGYFMTFMSLKSYPGWRFLVNCNPCRKGTYNFEGGYQFHEEINWKKIVDIDQDICKKCPLHGECENGGIKSKGAYWGEKSNVINKVKFFPCPTHYCCPTSKTCLSYDTCTNNRKGKLCSICEPGFSCTLNGNYKCVKNAECNHNISGILVIVVISSIGLVVLILHLKEILLFLKRILQTTDQKNCDDGESKLGQDENIDDYDDDDPAVSFKAKLIHMPPHISNCAVEYQLLSTTSHSDIVENNYKKSSTLLTGSVKILFFFYQASSIIRVQSPEKLVFTIPRFFDFLTTFFNVKIDLSYTNSSICILPDLNVIDVEVLKLGILGIIFMVIFFIWVIAYCHQHIVHLKRVSNALKNENFIRIGEDVPTYSKMPMLARIKCAYLQFLLLGYSSIAVFSFNAVHCITIGKESYLYQQASIKCYQPWQYFIIGVISFWIIPFCLVLHIGSKLLHRCLLTSNEFLGVLTFPPLLILYLIKSRVESKERKKLSKPDAMVAKHLLLVLSEPFKESPRNDGSRICWESMLIFRRMILIVMKTFILSPIVKLYPMGLLLLLFIFQHVMVSPFSDSRLNKLEFFSLNVIGSFVVVNIFWGITKEYSLSLMENDSYEMLGKFLLFYEMVFLALPFLIITFILVYSIFKKLFIYFKLNFRTVVVFKKD